MRKSIVMQMLGAALVAAGPVQGQERLAANTSEPPASVRATEPLPFAPGERMSYEVSLGVFGSVGEAGMEVVGREMVRGKETYRLRMDIEGGILFAKVDSRFESWVTTQEDFQSLRFYRDQHEVSYDRTQTINFFPDEMVWRSSNDDSGPLGSDKPLDDVSFLYYARLLPLEVGRTYTLDRYWKEDGNPVVIRVLGKQRITVPAGTFNTIVVQPIIQTDGLFGEGGEARVYFTDDSRHVLVQIKSKVPIIGDLTLKLKGYTPGDRPVTQGG